jgi:hypothetical protein
MGLEHQEKKRRRRRRRRKHIETTLIPPCHVALTTDSDCAASER